MSGTRAAPAANGGGCARVEISGNDGRDDEHDTGYNERLATSV